jgi:membrane-associated phospholipid phosphatase
MGSFSLYFVPFFTLVALGRGGNALRVAVTMAGIWAVGILFYFFVPVNEVWLAAKDPSYHLHVVNVLFERLPSAKVSDAYQTAVNNNFPSLHVALSTGIAMALWWGRERWLAAMATVVALGVTVATRYLGIHWVSDVVAGLALAAGASWSAHQIVLRRQAKAPSQPARISTAKWRSRGE